MYADLGDHLLLGGAGRLVGLDNGMSSRLEGRTALGDGWRRWP